jgi:hypothetical protein
MMFTLQLMINFCSRCAATRNAPRLVLPVRQIRAPAVTHWMMTAMSGDYHWNTMLTAAEEFTPFLLKPGLGGSGALGWRFDFIQRHSRKRVGGAYQMRRGLG